MGEITQLPDQVTRLVRMGKVALNQHDWPLASQHFEAAYQLEQSLSINLLLASSLIEAGDHQLALTLVEEQQAAYLQQTDLALFYFALLLSNQRFIQANQLWQVLNQATIDATTLETLRAMVVAAEAQYKATDQTTAKQLAKALYNITAHSMAEQLALLEQAACLPSDLYQASVVPVLNNPYCHAFVKSTVIETLVQLQITTPISLWWFDTQRTFVPAQTPLMADSVPFKAVLAGITERLAPQDPILMATVLANAQMDFAYLYPFEATVIDDPAEWAQAWIQQIDGADNHTSINISEKTQGWLEKLQEMTGNLDI